ncbi:MAG: hypothetical protein ACK5Q5_10945 [Planctomycetaceae bacterium]
MLTGQGEDGATAVVQEEAYRAQSWLQRQEQPSDLIEDCTESDGLTVWQAAPGGVVVLPEHYAPTYAYPALIWLAEQGDDEFAIRRWLEEISARNFVGIGLRPELYAPASMSASGTTQVSSTAVRPGLARFLSLLRSIEPWVRLHPDRRYVAGTGRAARTAVQWLLDRPQAFAGAIVIHPAATSAASWRTSGPMNSPRRVLWVCDGNEPTTADADTLALECLGVRLETVTSDAASSTLALSAEINRWVLSHISTAVLD